jgi:hypothetical protein
MINDTTIYHVNVRNFTDKVDGDKVPLPFRLTIDEEEEGLERGQWKWGGQMLHFNHGSKTNYGIFYHCIGDEGRPTFWLDLDMYVIPLQAMLESDIDPPFLSIKAPGHCELATLHALKRAL